MELESSASSSVPVHWLPVIIAVWFPLSFIITYTLAVSSGHVYPWWPSISSTGTLPPESCYFSLFVNVSAFLLVLAGYVRHVQLREFHRCCPETGPSPWINRVSSCFGFVSALGIYIVANWQVTNATVVHYFGAELCFFCGNIYFFFQTVFSFWMSPEMNSLLVCLLRGSLSVLMMVCIITCNYSNYISMKHFPGHNQTLVQQWKPDMPGYKWHIAYSSLEWTLMFCFSLAILTFWPDFKRIRLEEPVLKLKRRWNKQYSF